MSRLAELFPFNSPCRACLGIDSTFMYCVKRCVDGEGIGIIEQAERIGDTPHPHLHRQCRRCTFEWLERCVAIAVAEEAPPVMRMPPCGACQHLSAQASAPHGVCCTKMDAGGQLVDFSCFQPKESADARSY